jgi:zinc D-Ala-D-Ala dipeptidase
VQKKMRASFLRRLRQMHPDLAPKEIRKLLDTFAGPAVRVVKRLDTHRHGGAVDLTVVDHRGRELYMGTDHDDLTPKAGTKYYEKVRTLSHMDYTARKNRRILIHAMKKAGWVNYEPEWWHWSTAK